MPRMRDAIRSGWNTSSWSSFSPTDANLTGRPVTAHRQRRTAARVTVELRQHDPVEGDALLESPRDGDRLLSRHRVEHEQDVERLDLVADVRELVHQRVVDLESAGGIDDHDVAPVGLRVTALARGDDCIGRLGAVDRHAGAAARADRAG